MVKSIITESLPRVRFCSGRYHGHKRGKRQLLQSMILHRKYKSSAWGGIGEVIELVESGERPYLADGKRVDFEGWIGIQQVREGIPVGGNSRSIVIEVKMFGFC